MLTDPLSALARVLLADVLPPEEWSSISTVMTIISVGIVLLLLSMGVLVLLIRRVSRRTTQPCRWCMEFVPKTACVCPRCGKALS